MNDCGPRSDALSASLVSLCACGSRTPAALGCFLRARRSGVLERRDSNARGVVALSDVSSFGGTFSAVTWEPTQQEIEEVS